MLGSRGDEALAAGGALGIGDSVEHPRAVDLGSFDSAVSQGDGESCLGCRIRAG